MRRYLVVLVFTLIVLAGVVTVKAQSSTPTTGGMMTGCATPMAGMMASPMTSPMAGMMATPMASPMAGMMASPTACATSMP